MIKYFIAVGLVLVFAIFVRGRLWGQQAEPERYVSPWKTPWDYEGPRGAEHWSALDPDYALCNTGKEQSPIDIRNAEKADLPILRFESKIAPLKYVTNNRYTIRVNYRSGNENFLVVGDKRYELTQFHFHHPSEEHVNGKPYEMEAHLMYQTSDKQVAGVTVFIEPGPANATIEKMWQHMPKSEGQQEVRGVEISPAALLPRDTRGYYMYMGSVTAPPCTEGVTWFVLMQPIELSAEQISAFATLYPSDVRPIQPLNGRVVKRSQ